MKWNIPEYVIPDHVKKWKKAPEVIPDHENIVVGFFLETEFHARYDRNRNCFVIIVRGISFCVEPVIYWREFLENEKDEIFEQLS